MAGIRLNIPISRLRTPPPDRRTQEAFNQLVRDLRKCERELVKAERLLRRRPWKRFEIACQLEQAMISEFQLEKLFDRTGDPMLGEALTSAHELNEALDYAAIAVDEMALKAACTDLERAQAALAAIRTAIGSVMSLRFQRWGSHHPFYESPKASRDEAWLELFEELRPIA